MCVPRRPTIVSSMDRDVLVIAIEGQIGVGKTTLGEILEVDLGIPLYRELVKLETQRLLDRFYADKARWAFTLQIHLLNERFRIMKESLRSGGILDRSIFGDRIFASMLHDDGDMSDEEFSTYDTLLDNMLEHIEDPDLLVYLDCSVDTALARIRERNRGLEGGIPREYLENLGRRYLRWFEGYDRSAKCLIDTESLPLDREDTRSAVVSRIREAIKETQTRGSRKETRQRG